MSNLTRVDGFFVLTRIVLNTTSPPAITHNYYYHNKRQTF